MTKRNRHSIIAFDNTAFADAVALAMGIMPDTDLTARAKDSAAMVEYWDLTDAIVEGAGAVRNAGSKYFPKFPDENPATYDFRLENTKFTNVFRDIAETLASKPFEEEVALVVEEGKTIPTELEDLLENIDGSGNNLTVFAGLTFFNAIASAIDWIMVDYPAVNRSVIRTIADAKNAGLRPYWSHVLGRNVLESRSKIVGSNEVLTYMRILEPGAPDHVRVFNRDDGGLVTWALYRKETETNSSKIKWVLVGSGVVSIGVIPLVPFATGRRDGRTRKYFPVMRDAADLQKELYLQESALKFTKIMTAYPMLAANGIRAQRDSADKIVPVKVGPGAVLYSEPDGNGNIGGWSYVEPSATSLTFLASDIKDTIQQLRELGRLPLTASSGNLTTITAGVAAGKAKSAVGAWALLLKDALENALVLTCKWMGITPETYDPEVNVYNDFDNFIEGNTDLEHIRAMRDKGDLSQETLWVESKRRRVLSSEFDADEERERLLTEIPSDDKDVDDGNVDDKTIDDKGNANVDA